MRVAFLFSVFAMLAPMPAMAQHTLDNPVGEPIEHALDSGLVDNDALAPSVVFSEVVGVPNVAWMRLYFRDTKLQPGSSLRLTALFGGEVQRLDAAALSMWSDTSAYFNGNAVRVELIAGARTRGNRVALDHLVVEYGNAVHRQEYCGICGPDDRFPSSQDWSGRILNVGCSGTIWNVSSCVVSAGHCAGGANVIQFRVPASNPDCSLNHPPVSDQFPITAVLFDNNGLGDDWAVMTTGTNDVGQKAYDRYGAYRRIATAPANPGDSANVWGYGIDTECTRSQVQQDSNGGTIDSRTSVFYSFSIDITFGNSGSGFIHNDELIGIVTHCSDGCPDFATRADNADFAAARDSLCPGDCKTPVNYGAGTPGNSGYIPHITSRNKPRIGSQDFVLRGENTIPGLLGFLLVGFNKASLNYGSTTILVDVVGPHLVVPIKTVGLGLPGLGYAEVTTIIPNDIAFDNLEFFSQFLFYDPAAQSGLSATEGLDTTLCCDC